MKGKIKVIFLLWVLISIISFSIEIEEMTENIYSVKDEIYLENITPEMAKTKLLTGMREEVLVYVNGIEVKSNLLMQKSSNGKSNFQVISEQNLTGIILSEEILSEDKYTQDNHYILEMKVEFEIGEQKGKRDADYNLNISGVENIYREGEILNISYEVSKPSYVYIFIRDEDNNIYMYYPNRFSTSNKVDAKSKQIFPSKEFEIQMTTNGKEESTESLIVLASKNKINFIGFEYSRDFGIEISTYENYIKHLMKLDRSSVVSFESIYKIVK